jgi:Protein of unknown function (DUF3604)
MGRGKHRAAPVAALGLAVALGAWLAATAGRGGAQGDYLDPELRRAVERLKVDAARPAANAAEAGDRMRVLWRWANAHALAGGALPIDLPQKYVVEMLGVRSVSGRPEDARVAAKKTETKAFLSEVEGVVFPDFEDPAAVASSASAFVQRYVRELAANDGHPNALGSLRLTPPAEPLRAGALTRVVQTWTVGDLPMRPGGGLVLTGAITSGRGITLQTGDAKAEGYVTAISSRAGARLVPSQPWAEWRTFITRTVVAFRLEGAPLEPGDTVTIAYGDPSGGSPGLRVHRYSNDRLIFPVHLDFEGRGEVWTPKWPSIEVLGAPEIARVIALAPSVVEPNEPFTLAIRSEDRFKNLSSATTPEYEVLLDGAPFAQVPADSRALHTLEGVRLPKTGVHRFEVRAADGGLRGDGNPIWVKPSARNRVLWGDPHGHSGFAEGQGSPDGYYRFGRDVARLDFLSLSEHDMWMDDLEWKSLIEAVGRYRDPGKFTPLLGYEWTAFPQMGGHHNVYFADASASRRRVPMQEALELDELWSALRRSNATDDTLVIPHAHQAGDWRRSDGDLERLVEITSGHGSFEFFAQNYLESGFQVGFVGGGDNHNGHPGYTGIGNQQLGGLAAVIAAENTTQAIFRALRERSTYATTGERILLAATLNGESMGRRVSDAAVRTVEAQVAGTRPIEFVDVIKNGELVYRKGDRDGKVAITSRMWVRVALESATEVFNGHRNPRGARPWKGSLEVEGAKLLSWTDPWFAHPDSYKVSRPDPAAGRLDLRFLTRGRATALLLELDGVSAATRVTLRLDEMTELPADPGARDRPAAKLPAETIVFGLGDLAAGPVERELRVERNVDRVEARIAASGAALDVELEYRDTTPPQPGDWYFLRVTQIDGAMAWSSPWWVGSLRREGR